MAIINLMEVAPRVGAWIETVAAPSMPFHNPSHPVWVRGLKRSMYRAGEFLKRSHPVWVRGLKLVLFAAQFLTDGRTPCGCVD